MGIHMIQVPIVTQHQHFSRKINRKNSDIPIGVMQSFSRFCSTRKRFRINLVMTNNMSTCKSNLFTIDSLSENKQSHEWNCIGHNTVSEQ
jgi:hypothetical protein